MALFVVPILYVQRKQKSRTAKLLSDFLRLGESRQLRVTKHELWNDCYGIGLDEGQKKLFYVSTRNSNEQQLLVNLLDLKKSTVASVRREVNGSKIIDQVGLRLTPREGKELYLEFYNKEENLNMSGELQLAEKWNGLISGSIAAATVAGTAPERTIPA